MQQKKLNEVFYRITPNAETVQFEKVFEKYAYDNDESGLIRKAMRGHDARSSRSDIFEDSNFQISQSSCYRLVRLYHIYQKQVPLFPEEEQSSSFIEEQNSYNSFMAQSGLVAYEYLRTLLITQNINKEGYYEYFIKRNGQYYVQQCDDWIPVHKNSRKPLWSLSADHPWQLLLLKMWIKQCGSIQQVEKAEPFKFLQAFGLPLYRNYNFRKQLRFLKNQEKPNSTRKQNYDNFIMNRNDIIILAQTIDDSRVKKVGLLPNMAGYRLTRVSRPEEEGIFRVFSSLPCHWVGTLNAVRNTKFNEVYNFNMLLDLERNFLMSEKQLILYFNKFYVAPIEMNDSQTYLTQDCLHFSIGIQQSAWLCFEVKDYQGLLGIGIQFFSESSLIAMPEKNERIGNQFRFFLSKKRNQQQIERSHHRSDIFGSKSQDNLNQYSQSNCDKWQYIYVDYVQGYQNKSHFFCKVTEGFYVLHIISQRQSFLNVRFDSFVKISRPTKFFPTPKQVKQIFDSTFYSISENVSIQASLNKQTFEESICLNNSFQQFGYGSIVIKTLAQSPHQIAMKVSPQKFKQAGFYVICQSSNQFTLLSKRGKPQIIVLEKINKRSQSTLGVVFPPPNTVQFFKMTPFQQKHQ